jgi:hypothetical protein
MATKDRTLVAIILFQSFSGAQQFDSSGSTCKLVRTLNKEGSNMAEVKPKVSATIVITNHQRLFIRYLLFVLVDLTVLNLFVEYWHYVVIDSFTISLCAAFLLQVLMKLTTDIEQRIADHFKVKVGNGALAKRLLTTWALLFMSKFVILEVIDLIFGDHVDFGGILPFVVVVSAIFVSELILTRIYYRLAKS